MTAPQPNNVWYKNPFMTVFVIGLPTVVVVVCIFFIIYAMKIQDSTVRDDWYMDGKTLYQDASRDQLAYDLGVFGVMRFKDDGVVSFTLNYPKDSQQTDILSNGEPLTYPKTLLVNISHATDEQKDRDFTMHHVKDNLYQGKVKLDGERAKYYLQIASQDKLNWRLIQTQKLPAKNVAFAPLDSFKHENQSLPDQKNKRASQHPPS